jgi:hypothetical protein
MEVRKPIGFDDSMHDVCGELHFDCDASRHALREGLVPAGRD